jgi:phenylacetate-coenzyme A ligase PaaK-like adenylate-forming protein
MAQDINAGSLVGTEKWVRLTPDELWSIPYGEVKKVQLETAKRKFDDLVTRIPMLRKLATEQGVDAISDIDDIAKLLFRHNVYKSYPMSVLENGDFQRLTRWLNGLTTFDLTNLDASHCETIDEWIDLLDSKTEIRAIHSSGTTGKLSFLPRSEGEYSRLHLEIWRHYYEGFREEGENRIDGMEKMPIINPSYSSGALAGQRQLTQIIKHWHKGSGVPVISLIPARMSADAVSLGGRIRAAEARGELGQLRISEKLLSRREEFLRQAKEAPDRMGAFLDAIAQFRGQQVIMFGVLPLYFDMAVGAKKKGLDTMFAPTSLITMGGGNKGRDLPEGWERTLFNFLGRTVPNSYGMSEIMGGAVHGCREGNYHLQPWLILYLLDPKSGQILPRTGVVTGRLGLFDTLTSTYWGGFLSGDEVTISWDDAEPCRCGRIGPYLHPAIRRYSEKEGGDDKVTCAGAPEAQDKAIEFLLDIAG